MIDEHNLTLSRLKEIKENLSRLSPVAMPNATASLEARQNWLILLGDVEGIKAGILYAIAGDLPTDTRELISAICLLESKLLWQEAIRESLYERNSHWEERKNLEKDLPVSGM